MFISTWPLYCFLCFWHCSLLREDSKTFVECYNCVDSQDKEEMILTVILQDKIKKRMNKGHNV